MKTQIRLKHVLVFVRRHQMEQGFWVVLASQPTPPDRESDTRCILGDAPEDLQNKIVIAEPVGDNVEWSYRGASLAELLAFQTGGEWWNDVQFDGHRDLTLREIQAQLPWTIHYDSAFRESTMLHKHFGHALLHVMKAAGKLAAVVNRAEHAGDDFKPGSVDGYVADLVVCALRAANTCPNRIIDLQQAVEKRIESKNGVKLRR